MQYEIKKGVPLPERRIGRPPKYPFAEMEVGDSFDVPLTGVKGKSGMDEAAYAARQAGCTYAARHGTKYTIRVIREEGVARIWRVE